MFTEETSFRKCHENTFRHSLQAISENGLRCNMQARTDDTLNWCWPSDKSFTRNSATVDSAEVSSSSLRRCLSFCSAGVSFRA